MTAQTRQIAALRDVITGILFCLLIIFIMYTVPFLGIFAWMILPLPVLFFRLKTGRTGGLVIMLVSLLAWGLFARYAVFTVTYFGSLLITGFFMGECIEKHLPVEKIFLYTGLTIAVMLFAILFLYSLFQGEGPGRIITGYAARYQALSEQMANDSLSLYSRMDLNPEDVGKVVGLVAMVLPGLLINSYLTMVWLNILLIRRLLKARGIVVQNIENLDRWKAPFFPVPAVIVFSVMIFTLSGPLNIIALNGLMIVMFIYFFQGIAVVSYFFRKKRAPYALRYLVYILIVIQPLFLILVTGFGLFDTWADFRKINAAA